MPRVNEALNFPFPSSQYSAEAPGQCSGASALYVNIVLMLGIYTYFAT